MPVSGEPNVRVHPAISSIDAATWDRLAAPDGTPVDPFVTHAFLAALERSGSVGGRTGWRPCHLTLEQDGQITGAAPCYLKTHSQGEYIFDYGWAEAYERAGGSYYPKLLMRRAVHAGAGPAAAGRPGDGAEAREQLLLAARDRARRANSSCSSLHVTFLTEGEWRAPAPPAAAAAHRPAVPLAERRLCDLRRFPRDAGVAQAQGDAPRARRGDRAPASPSSTSTGAEITEAHWDAFFAFYMDTGSRKWGRPYLNRKFFSLLGEAMADRCLLVMAERDGRYVAGALNLIGGDCLYGRYWGCTEHHPFLHFELCYYQAIDYRDRAQARACRGRRPGRAQAGARLPADADLLGALDRRRRLSQGRRALSGRGAAAHGPAARGARRIRSLQEIRERSRSRLSAPLIRAYGRRHHMTISTIGFIGLGVMGEAMCRNLARKGAWKVVAFDQKIEPLERLRG